MKCTATTIGRLQLDKFVEAIPGIYSLQDSKRSIWDVWLHANHHASAIGEEIRKGIEGNEIFVEIADFTMWLFTLVNKLQGKVGEKHNNESEQEALVRIRGKYSDLLWNKYSYLCPVCYWRRTKGHRDREIESGFGNPCDCLVYEVERRNQDDKKLHFEALRGYAKDQLRSKPKTINQWQRMFSTVFESNQRHLTLVDIAFHLLEEMGEVSNAMVHMYTYVDPIEKGELAWRQTMLEEEIADVSSWLFALVDKLDLIRKTAENYDKWRFKAKLAQHDARSKPTLLSAIIWRRYGSDDLSCLYCPHCESPNICQCTIKFVPTDWSIDQLFARAV